VEKVLLPPSFPPLTEEELHYQRNADPHPAICVVEVAVAAEVFAAAAVAAFETDVVAEVVAAAVAACETDVV
jgi:urease accessory protein UreF